MEDYTKEELAELLLSISNGTADMKLKDYIFLKEIKNLTIEELVNYLKK